MLKTIVLLSVALNILVQSDASSWPKRYDNKDINIDDPQVGMYEGSADFASGHDDDDDEDIGRQLNPFPSVKPAQPSAPSDDEELVISGDGPVPASSPATPPRSHCQMKYDLATNPMVLGGYVPQCSSQGEYHPTQCHAGTGYCWCVDKSGDEIAGTKVPPGQTRPNCDAPGVMPPRPPLRGGPSTTAATTTTTTMSAKTLCQQQRDEITGKRVLGAFIPKCTVDGEFESVQCHHDRGCWCVNEIGDEVLGSRTSSAVQRPDCEEEVEEEVYRKENVVAPEMSGPGGDTDEGVPVEPDSDMEDEDDDEEYRNKLNQMPGHRDRDEAHPTWDPESNNIPEGSMYMHREPVSYERSYLFGHPGLLAAIIGGAVFGLLCAVLLVMFIVYRMRKKDEGSYPLDERKRPPVGYTRAYQREMYA